MTDTDLEVPKLNAWAQWVLRGLFELGGTSTPRDLWKHVAARLSDRLTHGQIARVLKKKYLRWASHDLRVAGYLTGEYGSWELTESGRVRAGLSKHEEIELPANIEELPPEEANYDGPTETVQVTSFEGLHIPIMRALQSGPVPKQELIAAVGVALEGALLPGDHRLMPSGYSVWSFRASWALTVLKKEGFLVNDSKAVWSLTDAGLARLEREGPSWKIEPFQSSKATVRGELDIGVVDNDIESLAWPTAEWAALEDELAAPILRSIERRVRPDLGPTPELSRATVPRNVVLYGPPGTGKTHVASLVAAALTGEERRVADGAWRLVQFHPSYSYEDFVQGMRPDLKEHVLRYEMKSGPFLSLCAAAAEDPDNFYVLVIDEINRGDPARIFGELLYALEYRGEPVDLALGGQLVVPPNVVVIGTMNSVDRSVALVDYALRRRFAFIRVDPEPGAIHSVRGRSAHTERAAAALTQMNVWLTARLDREHALGHSFFLNPALDLAEPNALEGIWREDLLPLLEEYFVGDAEGLAQAASEWTRILRAIDAGPKA